MRKYDNVWLFLIINIFWLYFINVKLYIYLIKKGGSMVLGESIGLEIEDKYLLSIYFMIGVRYKKW